MTAETILSQNIGNNFCILPWISVDRNNDLKEQALLGPCCLFEPNTDHTSINEYWTSEELDKVKQEMLDDKRPIQCRKCWLAEDSGIKSLRQSANAERLEKYKNSIHQNKPRQIKFDVGFECNLACRMCLPHLSSGVHKVWTALGKSNIKTVAKIDTYDYIIENAGSIDFIDIIGGEPFFHKRTKKLLSSLVETNDNEHIKIYAVTNATRLDSDILGLLKKFKDVTLSISLDAVGELHEYIRPGSNWSIIENNLKLLREANISLQITPCISVLNILHMQDLKRWCQDNDYNLAQPTVIEQPVEMAPHNLPKQLHHYVHDDYKKLVTRKSIDRDSLNFIRDLDLYWDTDIRKVSKPWSEVFDSLHWKNFQELKQIDAEMRKYVG